MLIRVNTILGFEVPIATSKSFYNIGCSLTPSITGFTYQTATIVPEKSLLLNIYQDSNKAETRYLPVQGSML
jgi:hypothetical protein